MKVVLIATIRPEWVRLVDVARRLRDIGAEVYLASTVDPQGRRPAGIVEIHWLRKDLSGRRNGVRPRRFSPRWARTVVRNVLVHARLRRAGPEVTTWLTAKYDPWFRNVARSADVVVAMERAGVYAAWKTAADLGTKRAYFGPDPLIQEFAEVGILNVVEKSVSLGTYAAADVVDAWLAVSSDPHHPALARLLPKTPRIVRALRSARAYDEAEQLARAALGPHLGPEENARLRLELTTIQLSRQAPLDVPLDDAVAEILERADQYFADGKLGGAADLVQRVSEAVFHRELHADTEKTPLVDSPERFLHRLHRSPSWRALSARHGEFADQVARKQSTVPDRPVLAEPGGGRRDPNRLLVVSGGNLHFARRLVEDVEQSTGTDVRWLDLRASGPAFGRRNRWTLIYDRVCDAAGWSIPALDPVAQETLAWPDVVFVDWCDGAAQWSALHLPRHVRLVIRLHSIEAVSPEPHMIDWSRVSDLIFVSDHVRECVQRQIPTLERAGNIHVVPNEMQLERFGLPKRPRADRSIAMIGWGQRVKDPLWALDVLAQLRKHDDAWRLLLIGSDFSASQLASGYAYRDAFRERAERADVAGGVEFLGYTEDLPETLRDAGFVLSASRRESFHVGTAEAAASAAVPVVRDWPMYAGYDAARRIFPSDWVVTTPEQAADRILAHADSQHRARAGAAARDYVVSRWDWPLVAPEYRRILSGGAVSS